MNAKCKRTVFVIASALLGATCLLRPSSAAPASEMPGGGGATVGSTTGDQPMSRDNVDQLLRQARVAIEQRNFDQADALLRRAEGARVHYPMFHFGPTPSSVRRELSQAEGKRRPQGLPSQQSQPVDRFAAQGPQSAVGGQAGEPGRTRDPFAGQNMPLPSVPASQPLPPSMGGNAYVDPDAIGAQQADNLPAIGRPAVNPFAAAPDRPVPDQYSTGAPGNYPVAQTSWNQYGGAPGQGNPGAMLPEANEQAPWRLPDAPLPPTIQSNPHVAGANGLEPPQRNQPRSTDQLATELPSSGASQKQIVQARLFAARQALEVGDLNAAEQLAREAGAVGVPESQYLPDEDRPSQLAWDIVRARQMQRGVQSVGATLPENVPRYAQQAGQMPLGVGRVMQAAADGGNTPAFDSEPDWAAGPEPLALPSESTPLPNTGLPNAAAPIADPSTPRIAGRTLPLHPQGPGATPPVAGRAPVNEAAGLLDAGEAALRMHDRKSALELFGQAHIMRDQLDSADQARLQDRLHMLATEPPAETPLDSNPGYPPPNSFPGPAPRTAAVDTPRAMFDSNEPIRGAAPASNVGAVPGNPPRYEAAEVEIESAEIPLDAGAAPFGAAPLASDVSISDSTTATGVPGAPVTPLPGGPAAITEGHAVPAEEFMGPADSVPLSPATPSLVDATTQGEQALARQVSAEVFKRQSEARRILEENPQEALRLLQEAQKLVNESKLSAENRRALLNRMQYTLNATEKYISDHKSEIDLDAANQAVMDDVKRQREVRVKVDEKKAELVNQFNQLKDEHRYAEAEIVARRLIELAPDDPVSQQVYEMAKFIRREYMNRELADLRERANFDALTDVEKASYADVGDGRELRFDQKHWEGFVQKRKGAKDRTHRRTERELEIERRLRTPVMLRYQDTPLTQVIDGLSQLAGVNIHLDPRGLSQEGVNSDTPVTVNLTKEISLKSALNLILEPLHLSYVIKDEVLKITSEQLRDGEIYQEVYNVADLVIPIPNFVPSSNIGLQGLINDAVSAMGYGQNGFGASPAVLVNNRNQRNGAAAPGSDVLAQQFNASPTPGISPSTVPVGSGPGGMGGGANADFDSLIDLIVSTVSTETWAENGGGEAEIRPFATNLSLVISQTQAVHEEIADLLEQLRRLQDLQVTIEVRFIRLSDSFFERIGVDFQMNIVDPQLVGGTPVTGGVLVPGNGIQSGTVGLLPPAFPNAAFPNFTADLDIPFRQGNFSTALPPFGGFDAATAANFGFAILSDLQAFFLIEAAQGDQRTNVLQAPKVTLFNGQQAFVADAISRPFVVGVIPVVGEFAAAQQPVIVVLNEGTMMTIQAVVSDDRRYVRLTVVPFFTQIGEVDEFTFEGSSSTTSSSSSSSGEDDDGKNESEEESEQQVRSGVTVQLPSFAFVSVVTTVSVPDGGTVLLGGIKRLSEGRSEFGVPLLSKVPYINRLFRNVGIGRETESLMMMVTPRIIIQEEEEERLGIAVP